MCDLNGKLFFSRDVIFNESIPGHLSPVHGQPVPIPIDAPTPLQNDRVLCSHSKSLSLIAEIISDRDERLSLSSIAPHPQQSLESVSAFIALNALDDLSAVEPDEFAILSTSKASFLPMPEYCFSSTSHYPYRFRIQDYDPDKAPESYNEAMARPNKDVWMAAMQWEKDSLEHRGSFECITLIPKDHKPIGVHWCYMFKYHPDGSIRRGQEKARLVAQEFSQ